MSQDDGRSFDAGDYVNRRTVLIGGAAAVGGALADGPLTSAVDSIGEALSGKPGAFHEAADDTAARLGRTLDDREDRWVDEGSVTVRTEHVGRIENGAKTYDAVVEVETPMVVDQWAGDADTETEYAERVGAPAAEMVYTAVDEFQALLSQNRNTDQPQVERVTTAFVDGQGGSATYTLDSQTAEDLYRQARTDGFDGYEAAFQEDHFTRDALDFNPA